MVVLVSPKLSKKEIKCAEGGGERGGKGGVGWQKKYFYRNQYIKRIFFSGTYDLFPRFFIFYTIVCLWRLLLESSFVYMFIHLPFQLITLQGEEQHIYWIAKKMNKYFQIFIFTFFVIFGIRKKNGFSPRLLFIENLLSHLSFSISIRSQTICFWQK